MDPYALAAVASQHAGAFSTAHALAAGWTARQIRFEREHKHWRRLYGGAYVAAQLWAGMDNQARALCHLHARLLVVGDGWHAARRSALLVHGLPFLGRPTLTPQLVRAPGSPTDRAASRYEQIAPLPKNHRALVGLCPVTSVARTVADHARSDSFLAGVIAADAALHHGLRRSELEAVTARCKQWPGAGRLRRVLAFSDGRSESVLESLSRVRMLELDLPEPTPQLQVWHGDELVARVDFGWPEYNLVGEADGRSKYTSVDDFWAEKKRERRLQNLGLEVVRWDWDKAWSQPLELAADIRRGVARGSLNTLDPDVRLVETSWELAA